MTAASAGILVDRDLAQLLGEAILWGEDAPAPSREQIQPASMDLRLGREAYRLRAGFLPGPVAVRDRLDELSLERVELDHSGLVMQRGSLWLVRLEEELRLSSDVAGRCNPRSSTGRCDLFTRTLACGHPRFDEIPPGYRGELWLEVAPLSFSTRLRRGDRLNQVRLARGRSSLDAAAIRSAWRQSPMAFLGEDPISPEALHLDEDGGLALTVGLFGRDPAGWRARRVSHVLEFSGEGAHAREDFWEAVHAPQGRTVLEPNRFTIFASRERIRIPPGFAAEMIPVDVGIGEMRNNYAGFFDPGFGWSEANPMHSPGTPAALPGTPAVLEVRAHDVPFLLEDGQVGFRLRLFRTLGRPERIYGEGRRSQSYADQDLTLARSFR